MNPMTLYIGSKRLSSWSLRPWLLMRHHELSFAESVISLDAPDTHARILTHSPSGRVPALVDGDIRVWESLAICEYVAETCALPRAWPLLPAARAMARSISQEMHAGFADLRRELPFNACREPERTSISVAAEVDIKRIRQLWREARRNYGTDGEWLFGKFGIADAMYAPVALRFFIYDIPLDGIERDYMHSVIMHPAVQQWMEAATLEHPGGESTLDRTQEVPAAATAAASGPAQASAISAAAAAIKAGAALPKVRSFQLPSD
ncbi:glutathione S-transferase family protein [Solimonas terrae]|uniref:Glutathione S-transferase family protein n=1 Tax=Solimonas terrae TaxID=1396819 RepID=A0A6M2BWZ3_9GAMM|nr:glutathione S-transferase family protein [Solimonas terrae]NGY06417.1 glutathione S-transferase family protein [Solimonas terrae]